MTPEMEEKLMQTTASTETQLTGFLKAHDEWKASHSKLHETSEARLTTLETDRNKLIGVFSVITIFVGSIIAWISRKI